MKKLLSRKFILTQEIILIASAFLILHILPVDSYIELLKIILLIYTSGNVATHITHQIKSSSTKKTDTSNSQKTLLD